MKYAFALLAVAVTALPAAEPFPFVLPWDDATPSVTNMTAYLEKPAGAKGFVQARDGHLYEGEKRIRFFGVNVAFGGNFPTHADAEKVAGRMAKFGINCVRFHHMDTGTAPAGLLQKDRRTLDPESLDRLDYFIAELKKQGIYANLNLHVGNKYPGMPEWEGGASYFKGVDNFYPPMIEQQRDYARALLTHVNAYTKLAYVDDPAVAFIEINNENGLTMEWNNGTLDNMPEQYATEFSRQWNAWLTKKYGTQEKLAAAWSEGEERLGAEMIDSDFDKKGGAWNLEVHSPAKAAVSAWAIEQEEVGAQFGKAAPDHSTSVAKIDVTQLSAEPWHVQFQHPKLALKAGKSYALSFLAKAEAPRKLTIGLGQAHEPWKVLWSGSTALTTAWQRFEFALVAPEGDAAARLSFSSLGAAKGEYSFADVSLREGGIAGLRDGERLGGLEFFRKKTIGKRTPAAQRDWHHFLFDTEAAYWPGMRAFIKDELHAKSLVLGSATGFSPWPVQAMLDVVDAHSYWQHPHFPRKQWDMNDWTVKNIAMAGAADGGALPAVALRRVEGKPFIVTEYNAAAPNTYSSEAFLELCAVAALQDWDGMFAFAYSHRLNDWRPGKITSFFDIDQHPTKMATLPAALTLFYRADLSPPQQAHIVETTAEGALDSIRKGGSWVDMRAYGIAPEEIFQRRVGMRIGASDSPKTDAPLAGEILRSENGELTWDTKGRRMLINTPKSVGLVGHVENGEKIELGQIVITTGKTMQNWATINVTSIDGAPIENSKRLLVTTTGYTVNTDMGWKDNAHTSVGSNWGKSPSVTEPISAVISFPTKQKLHIYALDERGQRRGEEVRPKAQEPGRFSFSIADSQKSVWWEFAAE